MDASCLSQGKYPMQPSRVKTRCQWAAYSIFLLMLLPAPASAQSIPEGDRYGDYYKNETPVQAASRQNKLSPGSLWTVVATWLNCRRQPSLNSPVYRIYQEGDLLEVEVWRGGSDEVLINAIDSNGKPWMPVRGRNLDDKCYVRANARYIQPVTK
ncbi:hypothetical protein V2H45_20075 [Tumidithrix elongata RA019]|uniref:SH3b domain-containing protein n=1 Tax=Tumidithrix elongata BACA0141 TaxID=2716417 RepID=A0AAW9Q979_9CYAN|nr:hypothetical protein [Tumidithrix elongata RA019]